MEIKKAKTQFEFFSLMKIRSLVFVCEQNVDPSLEIDDEDAICDHYILLDNNQIIATLRIVPHDNVWHIGRVAVLKEHRHKHCGSQLLSYIESLGKTKNISSLELGAQVSAIPFYEKNGYTCISDIFLDADIEHKMMEKKL